MPETRVILLGSTGSIGTQTIDVLTHLNALHQRGAWPGSYRVVGLASGGASPRIHEQAERLGVRELAVADPGSDASSSETNVRTGADAAEQLVREVEADLVVSAIVGLAGLPSTLAACELGRDVALANKETLVAAGPLVMGAARASGARVLPLDSEHSALWQCVQSCSEARGMYVPPAPCPPVRRAVITASGGALRDFTHEQLRQVTPAQALAHPNWDMGDKVTVDTATLMNKALELIEAHWLFGLLPDRLRAMVHPQSIVHAMVEHDDGSVIAQMGTPDMRTPIMLALTFPSRAPERAEPMDLSALSRLDFSEPDLDRFPALGLAPEVMHRGGTAGAVLNGANEVAVRAFLNGALPFVHVSELARDALDAIAPEPIDSLETVLRADTRGRAFALERIEAGTK